MALAASHSIRMRSMHRGSGRMEKRINSTRSQSNDMAERATGGKATGPTLNPDGASYPVNCSGTQVNIFGSPSAEYVSELVQQCRGQMGSNQPTASMGSDQFPYSYPYGPMYPPFGFTSQVQVGFMTEHMLRKLDESRLLSVGELVRNQTAPGPAVQEIPSPVQSRPQRLRSVEYDVKPSSNSPGNGDWRGQVKHIYAQLMDIANEDKNFRMSIGEPKLAEIVSADLEEDDDVYTLTLNFAKSQIEDQRKSKMTPNYERRPKLPLSTGRKSTGKLESSPPKTPASDQSAGRAQWSRRMDSKKKPMKQSGMEDDEYEKENYQQEGTLKPFKQFNAETDANALRKAMKGLGTDENVITNIFGTRSNPQRQEIIRTYKTQFGKDLIKDLKSELSGDYLRTIMALCQTPADYDAAALRRAIKGLGTDDDTIIEIICTRNNKSIAAIKESYKKQFNRSLEEDIMGDTSGHYQRLLVALVQGNRDESNSVDQDLAKKEAQALYDSGVSHWGTDESQFNAILVKRSYTQLRTTFKEYETLADQSIEDAIESEMSGGLKNGFLTIVQCVKDKVAYFAQKLYKAIKGLGTDDSALIRIVVSRCEIEMVQIKEVFQHQFKQSLAQFIEDDTSGDYRKLLLTLIGEANATK